MYYFILLLLVSFSYGKDILYYHDESSQWEVTSGTISVFDDSLVFKGDASADLLTRSFLQTPQGTLSTYIRHHDHSVSPTDLLHQSGKRCHCALKIRLGFTEVEIGENWLRVQKLTPNLMLDTILADTVNPHFESGKEQLVTLEFDEEVLSILIDNKPLISLQNHSINLHDISIASYMGAFTISSFLIESIYQERMIIDSARGYIDIPATFKPNQFNDMLTLKNHHFVTYEKGRAANGALFVTPIPDSTVHRALEKIGAVPGNNLTQASWEKRNNAKNSDPDIHAEGSDLVISIYHNGKRYPVEKILVDAKGGNHHFVFAGNLEFIPVWRSGCVVCLQSCPGSKVSNATYTMRDLAKKRVSFSVTPEILENEAMVWIRFSTGK